MPRDWHNGVKRPELAISTCNLVHSYTVWVCLIGNLLNPSWAGKNCLSWDKESWYLPSMSVFPFPMSPTLLVSGPISSYIPVPVPISACVSVVSSSKVSVLIRAARTVSAKTMKLNAHEKHYEARVVFHFTAASQRCSRHCTRGV